MRTLTTLDTATITRHRHREVAILNLAAAAYAVICLAVLTIPGAADLAAVAVPALLATVWLIRRLARTVRSRREDRADQRAAAAWRAAHGVPVRRPVSRSARIVRGRR